MRVGHSLYPQDIATIFLAARVATVHLTNGLLTDLDVGVAWFICFLTVVSPFVTLPTIQIEVAFEVEEPKESSYEPTTIPGWVRSMSADGVVTMTKIPDEEEEKEETDTEIEKEDDTMEETQEVKEYADELRRMVSEAKEEDTEGSAEYQEEIREFNTGVQEELRSRTD